MLAAVVLVFLFTIKGLVMMLKTLPSASTSSLTVQLNNALEKFSGLKGFLPVPFWRNGKPNV